MSDSIAPPGVVLWVGVHPCETVRLKAHKRRILKSWKTPDWLQYRLDQAGCAPMFSHWTGAIDICGLIRVQPGQLIDELTLLSAEEKLLYQCPQEPHNPPAISNRKAERVVLL